VSIFETDVHLVDDDLVLRANPRGSEPSPIPGVSRAELASMLDDIRWFSRLSVSERLHVAAEFRRWARRHAGNEATGGG